ncbi:MAG: heme ABC transporter permease [Gammaproteobacteria bacterium]
MTQFSLFFHRLASPPHFYELSKPWGRAFSWIALVLILVGLFGGLWLAPRDFQQGNGFRIMYVHVPSAWMSLFVFMVMAASAFVGLVWRMRLAYAVAAASAPLGAAFTAVALVTGSLWGKPMWGTYWVWDARLTSELILFFLYLGFITLNRSFEDQQTGDRAAAILALVGAVDIPIVHYSVDWWQTLHQGSSFKGLTSEIAPSMLWPLLVMMTGFMFYYGWLVLWRTRSEILLRESDREWTKRVVGS